MTWFLCLLLLITDDFYEKINKSMWNEWVINKII